MAFCDVAVSIYMHMLMDNLLESNEYSDSFHFFWKSEMEKPLNINVMTLSPMQTNNHKK